MDNRLIYEEKLSILLTSLKKTITDFSQAYDTQYNFFDSRPLFSVTSSKLSLLEKISYFNNHCVRKEMASLCENIHQIKASAYNQKHLNNIDFYRTVGKVKIGYYISMQEEYMPDIKDAIDAGIDKVVIIVLKTNVLNFPPNNSKYHNYDYKDKLANICLKEYFDSQCNGEYEIFQEYLGRFNYEAEIMLGLTVSPIPTQATLTQKWEKIKSEFQKCIFQECLEPLFDNDEIDCLKDYFHNNGLLNYSKADFVDSFISSEWYFDLLMNTDTEMEQTAIVAGYLKSIEQLLFSMMLSRSNTLKFTLASTAGDKNKTTFVPLSQDNKDKLLTMAGNLLNSIEINYSQKNKLDMVYVNSAIGAKVQKYLKQFVSHTRNGFLHKDNIYTKDQIIEIRKKTYGAYFLLGSAFKYDTSDFIN